MKRLLIITIAVIIAWAYLLGCNHRHNERVKISLNSWVGYAPLHYIHEKGWMDDEIDFYSVVSLMESVKMFQAGITDGFCGTQYEYKHSNLLAEVTVPAVLIDQSLGGDSVISNMSLADIRAYDGTIDVYLEVQSINSVIFEAFITGTGLDKSKFRLINSDQHNISKTRPNTAPVIMITYEPFKTELLHNGFQEIANTADLPVTVIDGLFVKKELAINNKELLIRLRDNINRAITVLQNDPQGFYLTVYPYMGSITYTEFLKAQNDIVWIVAGQTPELKAEIASQGIPTEWIAE